MRREASSPISTSAARGHLLQQLARDALVVRDEARHLRVAHDAREVAALGGGARAQLVLLLDAPCVHGLEARRREQYLQRDGREQLAIGPGERGVHVRTPGCRADPRRAPAQFTGVASAAASCGRAPMHQPSNRITCAGPPKYGHAARGRRSSTCLSNDGRAVGPDWRSFANVSRPSATSCVPGTPRVASSGCTSRPRACRSHA